MLIGRKAFTFILALAASLLLSPVASAQNTNASARDWSALRAVTQGSKLFVRLKNGKTVEGKLSGVSDSALTLSVKNKPEELKREDVQSVYQVRRKSAKKATLIGLGVGAGAGALVGVAGGDSSDDFPIVTKGQAAAALSALGGAAGALTGYLIGRGGHKRVLIYEAGQP